MKSMHRLLLVALPFGLAAVLSAQPSPGSGPHGPRGPRGPRHGSPIVRALDTNKDGVISADEIANAAASLKALDTNGDGIISADELRPMPPPDAPADMPPPPPPEADGTRPHPVDPIMLALDANGDGALSAAEIANATTSLKALDVNKDGQLTPDEFRPLPPEGAGGPPPSRR